MLSKFKKFYTDLKRKKLFSDFAVDLKHFKWKVAFYRLCSNIPVIPAKLPKLHRYYKNKLHLAIKEYLFNRCGHVIQEFNEMNISIEKNTVCNENNIWLFWWQGEENAPLLVKKCISSIRNNSGADTIYVLSKDNYKDFVNIPEYIIEKFEKGYIDKIKLSNIIRLSLLHQRGGLWLDATIFCSQKIPDEIFNYAFFSCRNTKNTSYNSDAFTWGAYILGSSKGSPVIKLILDCQLAYWKKEVLSIEYNYFDVIHELIYENAPRIKECMDFLPCNNELALEMFKEMRANRPFSKERLDELLHSDTYLFKLSWKPKFLEFSENGQKTLFHHYLYDFNEVISPRGTFS